MEVSKTCPICFEDLKEGYTATPDICDHAFCLSCLQKWAKREKVCPVDRKRFKKIIDLSTSVPIMIKPRKRKKQPELYDVTVRCEVCSKANNEDTLILCDCCDLGFHCKCLTPPLNAVPSGVWYCPMCVAVSEKIRTKKGLTKEVELVFKDHINVKSSSSQSDNSSDECLKETVKSNSYFNSKDSKSSQDSVKPRNLRRRSNLRINTYAESSRSLYESNFSYNKYGSTSTNRNASLRQKRGSKDSLCNERLKRLRPRRPRTKTLYTIDDDSSTSSEENNVEHKNYFLRKKNDSYPKITNYNFGDNSSSSEESTGVDRKKNCPRNKNDNNSRAMDLTATSQEFQQSKPLDLTFQEKNHEDFSFRFKAKHSIKKAFPEATITSGELSANNEFSLSDIVIEHTISLKSSNEFSNKTIEEAETDSPFNVSDVEKDKKHSQTCSTGDSAGCIENISESKSISPFTVSSSGESKNNLPLVDDCDFNVKNLKIDTSNLQSNEQSNQEIPTFSVFEKLDDDNSSQKKYCGINQAVNEKSFENVTDVYKNKSTSRVILPSTSSVGTCSDELNVNTHETKTLSEELHKMQKKKWKTYHLLSEKKCKCSLGLQWCHRHSKNRVIDSVQIGHHNKYSEHYYKLLSSTKPFIKKPRWNEHDLIILKNVRKKTDIVYSSENCSNNEIISMKAKNILKLKDAEKDLLNVVMCMSNSNDLAVRSDGTLFVNWKNRNSYKS